MRSIEPACAARWEIASIEVYSMLRTRPATSGGGLGRILERAMIPQARSMIGARTSDWRRSITGVSIIRDSDFRMSHSTAVMLDRVSNWEAIWKKELKKVSLMRERTSARSSVMALMSGFQEP